MRHLNYTPKGQSVCLYLLYVTPFSRFYPDIFHISRISIVIDSIYFYFILLLSDILFQILFNMRVKMSRKQIIALPFSDVPHNQRREEVGLFFVHSLKI